MAFISKYLPRHACDIMADMGDLKPIDMLWQNIRTKFTAILRNQKVMFIKGQVGKQAIRKIGNLLKA